MLRFFSLLLLISFMSFFAHAEKKKLLVLGDSLSAGYQLKTGNSWVDYIATSSHLVRLNFSVFNASFSGETSAGGLSRLPGLLQRHRPNAVLIALGGNDGLRGLPLSSFKTNLEGMFELVREKNALPLYAGVDLPPNFGTPFTEAFKKAQADATSTHNVPYLEFLLQPIADDRSNFMSDGIHPNLESQSLIGDYVLHWLISVLRQ